jgi:hypothetical protein
MSICFVIRVHVDVLHVTCLCSRRVQDGDIDHVAHVLLDSLCFCESAAAGAARVTEGSFMPVHTELSVELVRGPGHVYLSLLTW